MGAWLRAGTPKAPFQTHLSWVGLRIRPHNNRSYLRFSFFSFCSHFLEGVGWLRAMEDEIRLDDPRIRKDLVRIIAQYLEDSGYVGCLIFCLVILFCHLWWCNRR